MYFSKISIESHQALVECFRSAYSEHETIWNLMPVDESTSRDFLYHREESEGAVFYVVSKRQPIAKPGFRIQTKAYNPQLHTGQVLHFRLRANAVKTFTADGKSRRRDIVDAKVDSYKEKEAYKQNGELPSPAMVHHEAGHEWLIRQGSQHGFGVMELRVDNHQHHSIKKQGIKAPITFGSLDLSGTIVVQDTTLFHALLENGLGRSKSFGCGLLLIRSA